MSFTSNEVMPHSQHGNDTMEVSEHFFDLYSDPEGVFSPLTE